jgi:hypothetical protein
MELAVTTLLGPLVAKHRPLIPKPLGLVMKKSCLDARPNASSCSLRTQTQALAVAVQEGVHLLFNNICHFTDCTRIELGVLNDWQTDFRKSIRPKQASGACLH